MAAMSNASQCLHLIAFETVAVSLWQLCQNDGLCLHRCQMLAVLKVSSLQLCQLLATLQCVNTAAVSKQKQHIIVIQE